MKTIKDLLHPPPPTPAPPPPNPVANEIMAVFQERHGMALTANELYAGVRLNRAKFSLDAGPVGLSLGVAALFLIPEAEKVEEFRTALRRLIDGGTVTKHADSATGEAHYFLSKDQA